jgi:DNA repair exonuclease SbcCD nuclease subunit
MLDLSNSRRVWMITDTHFGVRNSLEEWIEIQRNYFFEEFIPLVRDNYVPGDVLFHMGDVFDSRHAITLKVMDLALDVFEELSKIFENGIYILCGNHDIYYRSSNHVNSLRMLKRIPGVTVIDTEPMSIKVSNSKFLMMPWQKDHDADVEAIKKYGPGHQYLMCHMDVYGMKGSRFNTIDKGVSVRAFEPFKRVYSGHIHYRQTMENIVMLGTPYELTRSDMYNEKCVLVLDPDNGNELLFPNKTSPKFLNIKMSTVLEKSPNELKSIFKNNFVDIHVDSPNFLRIPVNSIVELLDDVSRSLSFIPPSFTEQNVQDMSDENLKDFDIKDTIKKFCTESEYDDLTKAKLETALLKLYEKTLETYTHKDETISR